MNAADTDNTNRRAINRLLCAEAGSPCPHCNGLGGVPLVGNALEICEVCLGTGELSRVPQVLELAYPDGELVRVLIAGDDYGD